MTQTAVLAILFSAVIHAGWNLLSKHSKPTILFFLVATTSAAVFMSPVSLLYWNLWAEVPLSVWGALVLAGGFQAVYYAGLAGSYRHGELSVVYPFIRALPVLTVAGVSLSLGRGGQISVMGLLGMGLVALGCWLLPRRSFRRSELQDAETGFSSYLSSIRKTFRPDLALAFLAVLGTTGYTVTDDIGLAFMRGLPGISTSPGEVANVTLLYAFIETLFTLPWLVGLAFAFSRLKPSLRMKNSISWRNAVVAGVLIFIAYSLVLFAMSFVRDVSYVAAFRQVSIPIGAALGFFVEKEPVLLPKIAGLLIILTGLALVAAG